MDMQSRQEVTRLGFQRRRQQTRRWSFLQCTENLSWRRKATQLLEQHRLVALLLQFREEQRWRLLPKGNKTELRVNQNFTKLTYLNMFSVLKFDFTVKMILKVLVFIQSICPYQPLLYYITLRRSHWTFNAKSFITLKWVLQCFLQFKLNILNMLDWLAKNQKPFKANSPANSETILFWRQQHWPQLSIYFDNEIVDKK